MGRVWIFWLIGSVGLMAQAPSDDEPRGGAEDQTSTEWPAEPQPESSGWIPALFDGKLRLGGWFDVQLTDASTADREMEVGHAFFWGDVRLADRWRAMVEIGLRNPPGASSDTDVERLYLEYRRGVALKFRAGRFNTPAGLWKQLQWSIMVDTTRKPIIEESRLIPNMSTGLEVLGKRVRGDWEWNYDVFLAVAEDAPDAPLVPGTGDRDRLGVGTDLNVIWRQRIQAGLFAYDYTNHDKSTDPFPGDRRAWLIYSDLHLLPNVLSWRTEAIVLTREDRENFDGFYTKLKWQIDPRFFVNARYGELDRERTAGLLERERALNLSSSWWVTEWLRTRLEWSRHRIGGVTRYNEWTFWTGLLF